MFELEKREIDTVEGVLLVREMGIGETSELAEDAKIWDLFTATTTLNGEAVLEGMEVENASPKLSVALQVFLELNGFADAPEQS